MAAVATTPQVVCRKTRTRSWRPHGRGLVRRRATGLFKAYIRNRRVLWQFMRPGVNAPPVSYSSSGTQYVAVAAGGNVQLNYKRGNSVFVFSLAE